MSAATVSPGSTEVYTNLSSDFSLEIKMAFCALGVLLIGCGFLSSYFSASNAGGNAGGNAGCNAGCNDIQVPVPDLITDDRYDQLDNGSFNWFLEEH